MNQNLIYVYSVLDKVSCEKHVIIWKIRQEEEKC